MVDLSDGFDGPIEHGFSNVVFVIPAIIVIGVAGKRTYLDRTWNNISYSKVVSNTFRRKEFISGNKLEILLYT